MAQLKLRIKKVCMKKPVTKEPGFATRVLTNGTAEFFRAVHGLSH